jgi:general secretion pathway protein G
MFRSPAAPAHRASSRQRTSRQGKGPIVTNQALIRRSVRGGKASAGFTLVEILIVVVILGILAAIVVPQFVSAAGESRDNSLKMDLHRIRQQIEIYRQQHDGRVPTLADFEAQMTMSSNKLGQTATVGTPGYHFGPYIREIPVNPHTSTRDVGNGAIGSSAWYYDQTDGTFRANNSETAAAY